MAFFQEKIHGKLIYMTDVNVIAEVNDSEKRSLSKFLKDIETEKKTESKDYAKSAMEIGTRTSRSK